MHFFGRINAFFVTTQSATLPVLNNGIISVVAKKLQRIDFKDYTEMDIQASQTGQGAGAAGGSMSPDMTSAVGGGPTESNIGGADGQSVPPPQNEAEASSVGQGLNRFQQCQD